MARLGDICDILDYKRVPITAADRVSGPYPYYGANGVQDYVADYIFDDELVLLAEDGGHFGSADKPIAYRVSGKCWVNNHAHVLKPKECVDVDYLCYSLMYKDVSAIVNGATRQKLTQADMREIEVPLLSLQEQKMITSNLGKVFDLISLRKQQLAKLDELVKARFVELFGDPICNSKNLILSPLNDVCTKITDGTHDTPPRYDSGYLLITGKNIRSSGIIFNDIEFVSEEDHKIIYSRCNPEYGDVLYTYIGVNYGTACYNNLDYEFSMKNVALLKPNHRIVNGYYLWECLNIMRNHILSMNQVGGAQTFMGLATIKKITIPVPPIELQNQFATFVEQTDKSKAAIQDSLDKLETLKKALMQKYFG